MKFLHAHRKGAIASLALAVALLGGGAAFAYFTSTGSGTGSAKTGTATNVTISQVGAGYDSLIPSNSYTQDQCFNCDGPSEFGNDVTLANSGDQQLTSVVLAVRNWGPEIPSAPITLSINNTVAGPVTYTQSFDVPAATVVGAEPSTTDLTFTLASEGIFVQQEFVYGFTFGDEGGAPPGDPHGEGSLNIALSSSASNVSIGTDTSDGSVWLSDTFGNNNDFPLCTTGLSAGVFEKVVTNCGDYNPLNPGAYGTTPEVEAGSADIPAVEFNVVGGSLPLLYPGGPSEPIDYAITNPGSTSVHVGQVTTTVSGLSNTGSIGGDEACATSMYPIVNGPAINANVAPGVTVFSPSGTTIKMTDDGFNQDNCEGAVLALSFSSN